MSRHCSKLCLLTVIILVKKQQLGNFQQSNIGNKSEWVSKNFLSSTLCIYFKESKFWNWPLKIFKTVSAQMHYFAWKTTFSNFSALKYSQWKYMGEWNHFLSYTLYISAKVLNFKTDHSHFSNLCLVKRVVLFKKQKIFEFLSPQIFAMKTNKWRKTIPCLSKHTII